MKPTKNKIFCPGCKHTKMLFESKRKADNFIRYNSEEILEENGKAPVRSYYCKFCGGFHVTSKDISEEDEKKLEEKILKEKIKKNKLRISQLNESINDINTYIDFGEIQNAESLIGEVHKQLEEFKKDDKISEASFNKIQKSLENSEKVLNTIIYIFNKAEEERVMYYKLQEENLTRRFSDDIFEDVKNRLLIRKILSILNNASDLKQINIYFDLIENSIDILKEEHINTIIDLCSNIIKVISENKENIIIKRLNCKIELFKNQINKVSKQNLNKSIEGQSESLNESIEKTGKKNASRREKIDLDPKVNKIVHYKLILELINRIKKVQYLYNNNDVDKSKDELEIAQFLFDDLGFEDEHTALIKEFLNGWNVKLYD